MTKKVQHVMIQEEISSLKIVAPPPGPEKAPQRSYMTQHAFRTFFAQCNWPTLLLLLRQKIQNKTRKKIMCCD